MKKTLRLLLFLVVIPALSYFAFRYGQRKYHDYQWERSHAEFMAQATNTASENVTVLRDSILIPYQNSKRTVHVTSHRGTARTTPSATR